MLRFSILYLTRQGYRPNARASAMVRAHSMETALATFRRKHGARHKVERIDLIDATP